MPDITAIKMALYINNYSELIFSLSIIWETEECHYVSFHLKAMINHTWTEANVKLQYVNMPCRPIRNLHVFAMWWYMHQIPHIRSQIQTHLVTAYCKVTEPCTFFALFIIIRAPQLHTLQYFPCSSYVIVVASAQFKFSKVYRSTEKNCKEWQPTEKLGILT
jgi:hypothetical protein